ncbi:hypothetical protein L211DRAFT_212494 [Terfezia boudieri ATCC MYA-4762]|uniref:Uncharacterized protein n=1 Tax=Terfezia boudieri ATCC MYA-4762 TaxID=1051890 RepID=A0A3N4LMW7_9PEZI|nr:hypothetical protein L211DRAFT_212494 [Terfezia boudieri ATCC MYA-4762]
MIVVVLVLTSCLQLCPLCGLFFIAFIHKKWERNTILVVISGMDKCLLHSNYIIVVGTFYLFSGFLWY